MNGAKASILYLKNRSGYNKRRVIQNQKYYNGTQKYRNIPKNKSTFTFSSSMRLPRRDPPFLRFIVVLEDFEKANPATISKSDRCTYDSNAVILSCESMRCE